VTASVLLPAAAFAETAGTFVNLEGRWQSFSAAALPPGAARPAWKILRVLGNLLQVPDCDYQSSEQVRDELRAAVDAAPQLHHTAHAALSAPSAVESLRDVPMYQIDALLRRAPSLQATRIALDGAAEYGP